MAVCAEHIQKCDWTTLAKVADGAYHVVPVWWKPGKAVHDDQPFSLAVNIGHKVLSGLDEVVDLEEEEEAKGEHPAHPEEEGKGVQPPQKKQKTEP
eukprot:4612472-Amphidinium_carterae.1